MRISLSLGDGVASPCCDSMRTWNKTQDFAEVADMYTFHLEVVAPQLSNERHEAVVQLAKKVRPGSLVELAHARAT